MLRHMNKAAQQRERMEEDAMYDFEEIRKEDPEIAEAIQAEMARQNSHIELIASENWVSKAVMAARPGKDGGTAPPGVAEYVNNGGKHHAICETCHSEC